MAAQPQRVYHSPVLLLKDDPQVQIVNVRGIGYKLLS
jgi:hypothetical protein